MVCVLDFKKEVGLWHGVLTVSVCLCNVCTSLSLYVTVVVYGLIKSALKSTITGICHTSIYIEYIDISRTDGSSICALDIPEYNKRISLSSHYI